MLTKPKPNVPVQIARIAISFTNHKFLFHLLSCAEASRPGAPCLHIPANDPACQVQTRLPVARFGKLQTGIALCHGEHSLPLQTGRYHLLFLQLSETCPSSY